MHKVSEELRRELLERKAKRKGYSMRAFARDLKMSPAMLSMLMAGKIKPSLKTLLKLFDRLGISGQKELDCLLCWEPELSGLLGKRPPNLRELTSGECEMLADWQCYAVLGLQRFKGRTASPIFVARKLGIQVQTASQVLERLEKMGIIEIKKDRFRQLTPPLTATSKVRNEPIRRAHRQHLELARYCLDRNAPGQQVFGSITIPMRKADLPRAEKMMDEFKWRLFQELESKEPDSVFNLSLQLIPLTKD